MNRPRIYLSPPHMSGREQEYIAEVFAQNWIAPVGPHLTRFEEAFARRVGVEHAAAVTTGTAALHLALRLLAVEPGDEVLCSTFTFAASANPICYEGGRPVFIDSDPATWNMDPNLLEEELAALARRGKRPKAVIVVDILGQSADMDPLCEIAARYEVPVIDDAAEALGATYKGRPVGGRGWASTFSFNGNKIITTSGGGMFCASDPALVERVRFLATQARDPVPHYQHSHLGFNYRMSNVLAAIGLAQLEVLDARIAARRRNFEHYRRELSDLPGVSMMPIAPYGEPNYWLSVIRIEPDEFGRSNEEVRQALEALNIESRQVWLPLHRQPIFARCRCRGGAVAERLFEEGLCLPSGSALGEEELATITECIRSLAR